MTGPYGELLVNALETTCQALSAFDIVRLPDEKVNKIKQLGLFRKRQCSKKEVDEFCETLHNLTSLLLTNTTLRNTQQAVPNKVL